MKKQRYPDIISEYSASINDLSLYLFIPKSPKFPSSVAEVKPYLHTHSYIEIFVCTEDKFSIATDDGMITLFANDIARVNIMQKEGCPDNNIGLTPDKTSSFTPWIIRSGND